MAEVQKMGANQTPCWQCGEVVYKGTKICPKCGAVSPAVSIATTRKIASILLRVGVPVGIVSLVAGIIMFVMWEASMERVVDQLLGGLVVGDSTIFLAGGGGLLIACLLIVIGVSGVIAGPIAHFKLKKWDQQHTATREGQ
jgi:hypothetical protein